MLLAVSSATTLALLLSQQQALYPRPPTRFRRRILVPLVATDVTLNDDDDDSGGDDFLAALRSDDDDDNFLESLDTSLRRVADGGQELRSSRAGPAGDDGADERPGGGLFRSGHDGRRRFMPARSARESFGAIGEAYESYTQRPSQQFLLGALALLVGFYVSHGQLLGGGDQGLRWEYVSGAAATYVVERLTRGYHELPMRQRSPTLKLLHAFKVGFMYGIVLDALKLGG